MSTGVWPGPQKQASPSGFEQPRRWQCGNTRCSEDRSRCIIKRRVRLPFGQHGGRGGGGGGSGCLPWINGSAQWRFGWFHPKDSCETRVQRQRFTCHNHPLILSEASPHLKCVCLLAFTRTISHSCTM